MKDKKNDDTIADRVAKIKERQDRLEFKNNLYVYNEDGSYTDEILKIYNKERVEK